MDSDNSCYPANKCGKRLAFSERLCVCQRFAVCKRFGVGIGNPFGKRKRKPVGDRIGGG